MDKSKGPLRVALHAMEERTSKTMVMYLQGPCRGAAVVVNDDEADVDIFDADGMNSLRLMAEHRARKPHRPVIALSLRDGEIENVFYVKKPVKTDDMLGALSKAQVLLEKVKLKINSPPPPVVKSQSSQATKPVEPIVEKPVLKTYVIDDDERKKTAKHQAAMQLNEKGFGAFIGNVPGLDVNDPKQFAVAKYNPKDYFQGHVESAFKVSYAKGEVMQLNSGWSPLIIFPKKTEVWLDADDKQLRAFAGLVINNTLDGKMSATPLSIEASSLSRAMEKFHSMDAFLWKVACWASKGRYPVSIDIGQPVFLKNWPNFTRLLITPHALRISALLIQGPRTLPSIADTLKIKPQYVFVFISAACALGLTGQAKREADVIIEAPNEIKESKHKGFLSRIMSKLRN